MRREEREICKKNARGKMTGIIFFNKWLPFPCLCLTYELQNYFIKKKKRNYNAACIINEKKNKVSLLWALHLPV